MLHGGHYLATSEIEICNSALIKIGAARITSFSDGSKNAQICNEQYPKLRDEVLRAHPWNFAIRRVQLASVAAVPIQVDDDVTLQYQLPSDCLRLLKVSLPNIDDEWFKEGDKIICDSSELKIKYIGRVTEVGSFDASFCEALSWRMAADLAYAIAQSITLQGNMLDFYRRSIAEARSLDAQESGSIEQVDASEWFDRRF